MLFIIIVASVIAFAQGSKKVNEESKSSADAVLQVESSNGKLATTKDDWISTGCSCSLGENGKDVINFDHVYGKGNAYIQTNLVKYRLKFKSYRQKTKNSFTSTFEREAQTLVVSCISKLVVRAKGCNAETGCDDEVFTCDVEFKSGVHEKFYKALTGTCGC